MSSTRREEAPSPEVSEHGLKSDAIGFRDALIIGIASTAPAYSLAAVIGLVVVTVGVQAPAVLFASFVPMFFVATAFYYMNRADQDCGTTFSWVTRAMGPWPGWIGGWAICVTGILVVGSLADVAARYTYLFLGLDGAAGSKVAITLFAVVIIVAMTAVCVVGTELSARIQDVMIIAQVGALLLFAVVALARVFGGTAPEESLAPRASWFSPFAVPDASALIGGLLIGVFIYWGWESSVNLTEETENSESAPGLAAVASTVILLVTYLSVTTAVVAFAGVGTAREFADDDAILSTVATGVLGSPWDGLVVLAVLTSALASTQTTILPASRTVLSMARAGAMPASLGRTHPRFLTPHISTIVVGTLAIVWYVPLNFVSENFLFDTLSALSLMIAFYYALTGFACAIYYRHELLKSAKNFLFIGVAPVLGSLMLAYLFFRSMVDLANPGASYTGGSVFGLGVPLVIGLGFLLLGAIFMVLWRLGGHERFFGRRPEVAHPGATEGPLAQRETVGAPPEGD
ncbi:amino acid permease [Rubrobacter tropicus]|uniref:Amino acid permease n=1 Tax=Rubrobacter tropicus TaxID=2653851 RepID=A0A6G8QC32_9ACTN|nr:APC family permease [Rubrobacter tropicus]QIN84050.1 amino acid permease [Rubrobacter tropicus]